MSDRLQKLRVCLYEQKVDAALLSKSANIFYLTGFAGFSETEREGFIFVTKEKQYILTSMLHSTAVKKAATGFTICDITPLKTFADWVLELSAKHEVTLLGIETDNLTVAEYKRLSSGQKMKSLNLSQLRLIKTAEEIGYIEKACKIGDKAFSALQKDIKAGMTEKEVATKLESYIREHADISFKTIVAANANAAVPHHLTDDTKIQKNALLLFDFGVMYYRYCSDMSRTIMLGVPSKKQTDMYIAVKNAQESAAEYIRVQLKKGKKIKPTEPDKVARDYIIAQGFPPFPHSLGHGIGIEVHEPYRLSPYSEGYLENGMVFSIEPGIYLPEIGGVRIEDLYAIENNTLRQLTNAPKELLSLRI